MYSFPLLGNFCTFPGDINKMENVVYLMLFPIEMIPSMQYDAAWPKNGLQNGDWCSFIFMPKLVIVVY
jgi:hypothetical protein